MNYTVVRDTIYTAKRVEIEMAKLKLNDDVVGGINLYTVDNQLITSGKLSEVAKTLDALINLKHLEDIEERKMWH